MRDLDPRDAQVLEELYGPAPKKPKGKKRWRVAAVVLLTRFIRRRRTPKSPPPTGT